MSDHIYIHVKSSLGYIKATKTFTMKVGENCSAIAVAPGRVISRWLVFFLSFFAGMSEKSKRVPAESLKFT